jgi:hypothetical protein
MTETTPEIEPIIEPVPEPTVHPVTQQDIDTLNDIASEMMDERVAQIERWGQQDHPSSYSDIEVHQAKKAADYWKAVNDRRVDEGNLTWDGILLEEVFEALAESDDTLRREELVQVAAVAAAEIEAIDRRASESPVAEEPV